MSWLWGSGEDKQKGGSEGFSNDYNTGTGGQEFSTSDYSSSYSDSPLSTGESIPPSTM